MPTKSIGSDQMLIILGNWSEGSGPLYARLSEAMARAIERGELPRGSRLPPERSLAGAMALSRGTVVAAYDQLGEGRWVRRQQGSGTYVRGVEAAPPATGLDGIASSLDANTMFRGLITGTGDTIDFSLAAPRPAPAVLQAMPRLADFLSGGDALGRGYVPAGLPALRGQIAAYLSGLGLPTTEGQVLVTSGGQQALCLLASLWLSPGDGAVVENPTYHGALDAFRAARAHLISLPVDEDGARIDLLRQLLARTGPRLVYVSPTFNNPTGALLSKRRREELAQLAGEFHVPVVEDMVLGEVPLGDAPLPPPVAALGGDPWVMTVGSMSKLFWGGLRVGWIRASEQTIFRLAQLKAVADLGTSLVAQMLCVDLLRQASEVRAWRRQSTREQVRCLSQALAAELPSWTWMPPTGGNDLWVRLPQGNAGDFLQVAQRYGVTAASGTLFSADGSFGDHIRLTFLLDQADVEEGVRRLAQAWHAYLPRSMQAPLEMTTIV